MFIVFFSQGADIATNGYEVSMKKYSIILIVSNFFTQSDSHVGLFAVGKHAGLSIAVAIADVDVSGGVYHTDITTGPGDATGALGADEVWESGNVIA